jgi:hypothetical protein
MEKDKSRDEVVPKIYLRAAIILIVGYYVVCWWAAEPKKSLATNLRNIHRVTPTRVTDTRPSYSPPKNSPTQHSQPLETESSIRVDLVTAKGETSLSKMKNRGKEGKLKVLRLQRLVWLYLRFP